MADQIMIGAGIKLDGEADFAKAVANISKNQSVLASEMRKVTAEFADNATSEKALSALTEEYNKKIAVQENKVNLLKSALENARKEYGDNSDQVKNWQIKLNNAETQLAQSQSALKGLDTELKKSDTALEEAGDSAEKSGERFSKYGDVLKGVGVSLGAIAVAAGAAAIKLGQEVVEQFGELEQNLGGSEAVFGEYAASIQKTGEEAYKNLGASQSEYLANANKMGALLQGAGIAQQESLDLTVKAMQRAADMASVMGIDTSSALEAVTGAAKGNFTMMDNLGVAMNATTIQAYALSKGLDFTWATASNADKAQLAMQMFFEQTEQYAGNFAREATETISGSIGLLKSALASFTAGLGNAEADMTNLTQNLVDAFEAVVDNIVPVLGNIVSALPQVTGELSKAIIELLPTFLEAGSQIVTSLIQGITEQLPELADGAFQVVNEFINSLLDLAPDILLAGADVVVKLANGIAQSLPELIPAATDAIMTFVQGLADRLPDILQAALDLVVGLADGILDALPELIARLPELVKSITDFLIGDETRAKLAKAAVDMFSGLLSDLPGIINGMSASIAEMITGIIGVITSDENKDKMGDAGTELFTSLIDVPKIVESILDIIPNIIKGVIEGISGKSLDEMFSGTDLETVNNLLYATAGPAASYHGIKSSLDKLSGESGTQTSEASSESSGAGGGSRFGKTSKSSAGESSGTEDLAKDTTVTDKSDALTSALGETTAAVTSLGDTITKAASSAGITLSDSVEEAAQKIITEQKKDQALEELTAKAAQRAKEILENDALDRSDHTTAQVIGDDGKIAWMFMPSQSTNTSVVNNTSKVEKPTINYNITADLSKVKDLAGLIKAVDEAEQLQKAGYVE